jgi:hypothetical protein
MSTWSTCTAFQIGSKTPVDKAEGEHPADELVGQEVIDPEDHRLAQLDAQDLVEVLRRGEVGAEGFFDRQRVGGAQVGCGQGRQHRRQQAWGSVG